MTKLPSGIQTFSEIREGNYTYADKTQDIHKLIENGKYYFLSRPRRFGKSLLIDTIAELFKGSKGYFEGLYIYDKWDWSVAYPVVKINFGGGDYSSAESLKNHINDVIADNCDNLGLDVVGCGSLGSLVKKAQKRYGQKVAVLVDEYDKPIIDVIGNKEQAQKNRSVLGSFYSAIKASDEYVRFAMLTGVSKFSKVNLFSNLNNLTDITIDEAYGTISGFTQKDLETTFKEHLKGFDMERVRRWYNGYSYFAEPIYNPFDILQFILKKGVFKNYWWETGNPSFLIEVLKDSDFYIPDLDHIVVEEEDLNAFDVERIGLIALLWQTGYLTFDKMESYESGIEYTMRIPNLEVKNALNHLFLTYLSGCNVSLPKKSVVHKAIGEGDVDGFVSVIKSLFASIPYNNHVKNTMARYEGYYASVLYTFLCSLGYDTVAEDVTNKGRIDLTLKTRNSIYIFEFKVDSPEEPLKQIKERGYGRKYRGEGKPVYLVGISFDSVERGVGAVRWERG